MTLGAWDRAQGATGSSAHTPPGSFHIPPGPGSIPTGWRSQPGKGAYPLPGTAAVTAPIPTARTAPRSGPRSRSFSTRALLRVLSPQRTPLSGCQAPHRESRARARI